MKITDVPALKINKLTRQQFKKAVEENRINDNEIYLTPDCAEPYYVYIDVDGSDIKLDTFHEFSGEEFLDAIAEYRPIYLREDEENGQQFIFTKYDWDEGCALFSRTSIVNNTLQVQQVTLSSDGTIGSSIATNKTDATLTLQNRAADAAAVGQRLAALEAASTPAYTYGEEDLIPGETPLETGKLHFVYI